MIVLVRHGETAPNRRGAALGRADVPLTPRGHRQAHAVAEALLALTDGTARRPVADPSPTQAPVRSPVVSSPLRRARQTAEVIAARLGVDVVLDDRLVELDYGTWDTLDWSELPREALARWRADPSFAPPGGESLTAVARRMASFCAQHLPDPRQEPGDGSAGGPVVAVSHVSPIKAAVTWALGVDVGRSWHMHLDLASITRLRRTPGGVTLASFNETAHLHHRPRG